VNYGGSAGYGRSYTERLKGKWGVVDVQDVLAAASALSSGPNAKVDPKRLAIRGGSSGGYTVLATLVDQKRPDAFGAGTSYYGISDLKAVCLGLTQRSDRRLK
jgi:dipeptidyl aminopeptidase/acylaminoacyl peptidase